MSTAAKVIGFLVTLAVVLGGAYGVGRLTGGPNGDGQTRAESETPPGATSTTKTHGHGSGNSEQPTTGSEPGGHESGGHESSGTESGGHQHEAAPGTSATAEGHTLTLLTPIVGPGRSAVELIITGPDGRPVTDYDVIHEKELHLIAVREDLSGFNHVHPVRAEDGTWRTTLDLAPGTWRIYADVQPTPLTEPVVLGADLTVTGTPSEKPLPAPGRTAQVDGYTVTLDGTLAEGEQELAFTITRDGKPVTDLQPYLGAHAHIVALRLHDLAYTHVHPQDGPPGPQVLAHVAFTSNGQYRTYVEFRHEDKVHRAEFTLDIP